MFKLSKISCCLLFLFSFLYNTFAQCNVTLNEDIIFIVDASTHFNSTDWIHIKTLLNSTISKSPTNARYGLITCSLTCSTYLSLTSNVYGSSAYAYVNSLSQNTTQTTFKAYLGYVAAKNDFVTYSSQSTRKTLIMIAGGTSSDNQCQTDMRKLSNINGVVITMGQYYYKYVYACIAKDRTTGYISQYETFSSSVVSSLTSSLTYHTCPAKPILYFTEIQPTADSSNNGRFVELFNDGWAVDLRNLSFTGLFEGTLTNASTLIQGQFLVLYWGNDTGLVHCNNCNGNGVTTCTLQQKTLTASYWCTESKYLACSKGTTYAAASYETKDDGCKVNTQTNANFNVSVYYSGSLIDFIKYDSTDYWYKTPVNNSLELKYLGYNNDYGSSWVMSCNASGSPGAHRVSGCACTGATTYCSATGASSATCSAGNCSCNTNGYYNFESGCYPFPSPDNCTAVVIAGSSSTYQIDYLVAIPEWDGLPSFLLDKVCIGTCEQKKGVTGPLDSVTGITSINSTATAQLRLEQDNTVLSNSTNCTIRTHAPTMVPTSAPTYILPSIPNCTVTLNSALNGYVVSWTAPVYNYPTTPGTDDFQSYRVYQNNILGPTNFVAQITDNNTLSTSVTMSNTNPTNWTLGATNVSVGVLFNSISDTIDTQNATTCKTVLTQAPTNYPTKVPTKIPTKVPTNLPTPLPTFAPTLSSLEISECYVKMLAKQTTQSNLTWKEPNFNATTANRSSTEYVVTWPGGLFTFPGSTNNSTGVQMTMTGFNITTEYNNISMYASWTYTIGSSSYTGKSTTNRTCTFSTLSPTAAPTQVPTIVPTPYPTNFPTTVPTRIPTLSPTLSPTYTIESVTNCTATFGNGDKKMTVRWKVITIDPPNTPNATDVYYEVLTPDGFTDIDHSTLSLDNDSFATKVISLTNAFNYNSSINITVRYKDSAKTASSYCEIGTAAPTPSPTPPPTSYPTQAPTYGIVYVWLVGDEIASCKVFDNDSEITRCGCTNDNYTSNACDNNYTPIDLVDEKQQGKVTSYFVQRSYVTYDYNISITYSFSYVNNTTANEYGFYYSIKDLEKSFDINTSDSNLIPNWIIPNDTYWEDSLYTISGTTGPTQNDIQTWNGSFVLTTTFDTGTFDVLIQKEFSEDGSLSKTARDDYPGEIFLLTLTSCNVVPRYDYQNIDNDTLICQLVYPLQTFVMINDKDVYDQTGTKVSKNDSWQDWFWYALIAIILFLMILGYFVYRWWVNKKLAQAEVQQTEADIDAVIEEQEGGFANDLGDNQISINPMAQGLAHLKKPNQNMAGQKGNTNTNLTEQAQVNVEKFHERQEFGPQQINRGEVV